MSLRNNAQYFENKVYELEARLSSANAAREKAEAALDEGRDAPYCSYCKESFPGASWEDLQSHIYECAHHPLCKERKAREAAEQRALAAEARLAAAVKAWGPNEAACVDVDGMDAALADASPPLAVLEETVGASLMNGKHGICIVADLPAGCAGVNDHILIVVLKGADRG